MRILFCLFVLMFIYSCGGGGGSSGNNGSSSGSNQSGSYSINLDKNAITINIPYGGGSNPQRVQANFSGDGVIVGYPSGATPDENITVEIESQTTSSASFIIDVLPWVELNPGAQYTTTLRFLSGKADGSKVVYDELQVTVIQLDGFAVNLSDHRFNGTWGEQQSISVEIDTYAKSWTVQSDFAGLLIEPMSGSGRQNISLSYDPELTPVGEYTASVTFSAGTGEQVPIELDFNLEVPWFTSSDTIIQIPNAVAGQATPPIALDITFQGGMQVPWELQLDSWLQASNTSGLSGADSLELVVLPEQFPESSLVMQATATVVFDIPGVEVTKTFDISFPYEPFYYQTSPSAFAFSDYATADAHAGVIRVNMDVNPEDVTVSDDWIVIDEVAGRNIAFHLDTSSMELGFTETHIEIGGQDFKGLVSTQVNVGYFKSSSAMTFGEISEWGSAARAVPDKLGPWVYVARPFDDQWADIVKYNFHTQAIESTLSIDGIPSVDTLTLSDDGKTLFGFGYDWDRYTGLLVTVDLNDFTSYTVQDIGTTQFPEFIRYARFNGLPMIADGIAWFNANTAERIQYNADSERSVYLQTGEYRFTAWGSPGLEIEKYTYSYLTNSITDSQQSSFGGGYYEDLQLSNNANWIVAPSQQSEGEITLIDLEFDELNLPELSSNTRYLGQFSDYPESIVNSSGTVAVKEQGFFWDETEGERRINIYNNLLEPVTAYSIGNTNYLGLKWFFFTGDEKFVSYQVVDEVEAISWMYLQTAE